MKRLILFVLMLVPSLAWAADEVVWTVTETKSARFADRDVVGPTFAAGTKLVVLVRDGDRLRVRGGEDLGWIGQASTTSVAPPEETSFDIEAMRKQLEAMGFDPSKMPAGGGMAPGGATPPGGIPMVPSPVTAPVPGK